jgi:hypothetical protein
MLKKYFWGIMLMLFWLNGYAWGEISIQLGFRQFASFENELKPINKIVIIASTEPITGKFEVQITPKLVGTANESDFLDGFGSLDGNSIWAITCPLPNKACVGIQDFGTMWGAQSDGIKEDTEYVQPIILNKKIIYNTTGQNIKFVESLKLYLIDEDGETPSSIPLGNIDDYDFTKISLNSQDASVDFSKEFLSNAAIASRGLSSPFMVTPSLICKLFPLLCKYSLEFKNLMLPGGKAHGSVKFFYSSDGSLVTATPTSYSPAFWYETISLKPDPATGDVLIGFDFSYRKENMSDTDRLIVAINDEILLSLKGIDIPSNIFTKTGIFDLLPYTGQDVTLTIGLLSEEANHSVNLTKFNVYAAKQESFIYYVSENSGCSGQAPCFESIGAAYQDSKNGQQIKISTGFYAGDLSLENPIDITLSGGWNSDYSVKPEGYATIIGGSLTISGGSATVEEIVIDQ